MIFHQEELTVILENAKDCETVPVDQYVVSMVEGVKQNETMLDDFIKPYLQQWTIDRISKISLSVLRLAIYEMIFNKDLEAAIIINEAIEIAKYFSTEQDAAFINGVLGSFVRDREKNESISSRRSRIYWYSFCQGTSTFWF